MVFPETMPFFVSAISGYNLNPCEVIWAILGVVWKLARELERNGVVTNSYADGKLLACERESRFRGKGRARYPVSASDKTRQQCNSVDHEVTPGMKPCSVSGD
jgi:hypothetical protein